MSTTEIARISNRQIVPPTWVSDNHMPSVIAVAPQQRAVTLHQLVPCPVLRPRRSWSMAGISIAALALLFVMIATLMTIIVLTGIPIPYPIVEFTTAAFPFDLGIRAELLLSEMAIGLSSAALSVACCCIPSKYHFDQKGLGSFIGRILSANLVGWVVYLFGSLIIS